MKRIIMVAALFLVLGLSVNAQEQNFSLVNGTDFVISYVYISPSAAETWGEDILTVDVLGSGEQCDISFANHDECYWDIKAVAADGSEAVWSGIDLCESYVITLTMTADGPVAEIE